MITKTCFIVAKYVMIVWYITINCTVDGWLDKLKKLTPDKSRSKPSQLSVDGFSCKLSIKYDITY